MHLLKTFEPSKRSPGHGLSAGTIQSSRAEARQ